MLCKQCLKSEEFVNINVDICDEEKYEFTCSKGHKNLVYTDHVRYAILFEMGAYALVDGYKLEAIASMTSAMERFHEWCVSVLLRKNKVEYTEFEETWKLVGSQSERQLGAFYFLYLLEFKEKPNAFDNSKSKFRNKIIHNGYLPTDKEAYEYCEYVYKYIRDIQNKFYNNFRDYIEDLKMYKLDKLRNKYGCSHDGIYSLGTILSVLAFANDETSTFKFALDYVKSKLNSKL